MKYRKKKKMNLENVQKTLIMLSRNLTWIRSQDCYLIVYETPQYPNNWHIMYRDQSVLTWKMYSKYK